MISPGVETGIVLRMHSGQWTPAEIARDMRLTRGEVATTIKRLRRENKLFRPRPRLKHITGPRLDIQEGYIIEAHAYVGALVARGLTGPQIARRSNLRYASQDDLIYDLAAKWFAEDGHKTDEDLV